MPIIAGVDQFIITQGIEHWPVYVGMIALMFASWKWIIPSSMKSSMENGGGEAIRRVVKDELVKQDNRFDQKLSDQDAKNKDKLTETIARHEATEVKTLEFLLLKITSASDAQIFKLEKHIDAVENKVNVVERAVNESADMLHELKRTQ